MCACQFMGRLLKSLLRMMKDAFGGFFGIWGCSSFDGKVSKVLYLQCSSKMVVQHVLKKKLLKSFHMFFRLS